MTSKPMHAYILALFAAAAQGADDPDQKPAAAAADPRLTQARAAIAKQDWASAQGVLRQALAANAANPEYHNLFAYALRKSGTRDLDQVFKHYHEALRLDAKHRGAHEYIGEAYLMAGNLAKAKEHLKQLDSLCFFGCEEYNTLKKAVTEFESKQAKK